MLEHARACITNALRSGELVAREKDDEGRSQSLGSENRANEGSGERLRLKGAVRRVWSVGREVWGVT